MIKTHELFPTRVYEFRLEGDDMAMSDQALEYIKTLNMQMYNFPAGVRTSKGDLHKDEPMQEMTGFFHDCLDYIRCDLALQVEELRISLSWANWAPPQSGAGHPLHRHNYSYLSGVYYFTEGSDTVFHDPVDIRNLDTLEITRDFFDGPEERITAEPGKLLIFPGWLRHYSNPHSGKKDRYTMSFNSLPHGPVNAGPQGVPYGKHQRIMIDPTRFDFPSIFGVVKSTDGLKRRQTRPLRAEVQEISIAKYSGGQLNYVGATAIGQDFLGLEDGLRYESKGKDNLFCKRIPWTSEITLKNFQGNNTGVPEKTFDYMLLWDTATYTVAICTWDACMKHVTLKDDSVKFRVHTDDLTFLAKNVTPIDKGDFASQLYNLIESTV